MTNQVGTVRWSAPEQLTSGHYDVKADIWSYGVVVWEVFHRLSHGSYQMPYPELAYDYFVIR
jgi:protein tyrosine kinase 6